ncbi:MAG: hypothetical protein WCB27_04220, partial [Thermoguttaceae bacterium]
MKHGKESTPPNEKPQPPVAPFGNRYWRSIEELARLSGTSHPSETPPDCNRGALQSGNNLSGLAATGEFETLLRNSFVGGDSCR